MREQFFLFCEICDLPCPIVSFIFLCIDYIFLVNPAQPFLSAMAESRTADRLVSPDVETGLCWNRLKYRCCANRFDSCFTYRIDNKGRPIDASTRSCPNPDAQPGLFSVEPVPTVAAGLRVLPEIQCHWHEMVKRPRVWSRRRLPEAAPSGHGACPGPVLFL